MTARPPAVMTASATSGSQQAIATSPTSAASACRNTRTTIGTPPMSASGFPGKRLAAMRAGMITIGRMRGKYTFLGHPVIERRRARHRGSVCCAAQLREAAAPS